MVKLSFSTWTGCIKSLDIDTALIKFWCPLNLVIFFMLKPQISMCFIVIVCDRQKQSSAQLWRNSFQTEMWKDWGTFVFSAPFFTTVDAVTAASLLGVCLTCLKLGLLFYNITLLSSFCGLFSNVLKQACGNFPEHLDLDVDYTGHRWRKGGWIQIHTCWFIYLNV